MAESSCVDSILAEGLCICEERRGSVVGASNVGCALLVREPRTVDADVFVVNLVEVGEDSSHSARIGSFVGERRCQNGSSGGE